MSNVHAMRVVPEQWGQHGEGSTVVDRLDPSHRNPEAF